VLASGSGDNTVRLWDVAGGHELRTLSGHTRPVTSLAFSPDGKMLASSSNDYTFKLWDVTTGRERISVHEDAPVFVAFSPDGKVLAGRFDDGYYRLTCR